MRRVPLPAIRLLAVLSLFALAAALHGAPQVEGQTVVTLVKNTSQPASTFNATLDTAGATRAQGFQTGSNQDGYVLSQIRIRFGQVTETAAADKITVTLREESGGNPGSEVCTLTNPDSIAANSGNEFTAPDACGVLAANTSLFVVLERTDASGNSIALNVTTSAVEELRRPGWSILNSRHQGDWTTTSGESYLIEVKGTPITDTITLVKNTDQVASTFDATLDTLGDKRAQGFQTGSSQDGYVLSQVGIRFGAITDTAAADKITVTLREESGGNPGAEVCTLTNPGSVASNTVNQFAAPDACGVLAAETLYFIVVERTDASGDSIALRFTTAEAEELKRPGWSILNSRHQAGWVTMSSQSYMIEVKGAPVQYPRALVSNTGQSAAGGLQLVDNSPRLALRFTTGSHPRGYQLSAIDLWFALVGSTATTENIAAALYSVSDGAPDEELCALEPSAAFAGTAVALAANTFTAPSGDDACPVLSAETVFAVVLKRVSGSPLLAWAYTTSTSEDTLVPATGFSIANRNDLYRNGDWAVSTAVEIPMIEIRGTPKTFGVTISEDSLTVPEGGSDSYTIVLDKQPTADVIIDITAGGDVTTQPGSVTFTTENWDTAQSVSVSAAQDNDGADDSVTISHAVAAGSAAEYLDDPIDDLHVTVDDDEGTVNICDRTWWVRDEILRQTPTDDTCTYVLLSELASITEMDFSGLGPGGGGVFHNSLNHDDFRGLTGLTRLDLSRLGLNAFEHADGFTRQALPEGIFADLTNLTYLSLKDNRINPTLRDGVFESLGNLTELDLRGYSQNPGGRNHPSGSQRICWTDEQRARVHTEYPWNPRLGSPRAFLPLTSLVTYNWDTKIKGLDTYTPEPYATNNYRNRFQFIDGPTNLAAQAAGRMVGLSWDAPTNAPANIRYRIERDVDGLGALIQSCGSTGNFYEQIDRFGDPVGLASGTWFADSMAGLNNQDLQHMDSLTYYVIAVTDNGESLPVSVDVDMLDSFRRHWDYGFAVRDASVYEGSDSEGNLNTLNFEVTLRERPGQTTRRTVEYRTVGVSATAKASCEDDADYIWAIGRLVFQGGSTQTVKVTVCDDMEEDSWETLQLVLFNASDETAIPRDTAIGLIINSETPAEPVDSSATGVPTINGTAQAGKTLTAITSGIADADGLTNVSYAYQWLADDAEIEHATGSTYEVSADDVGKTIKVTVSFTDDAGNEESLSSAATATVIAATPSPLTVSLVNAPDSHDGSTAFTFEIKFSEHFPLGFSRLEDDAFGESGGDVDRAQRLDPPSNIRWLITVDPDGEEDVTIALPITTLCTAQGAICTEDGRMLSNALQFTVKGPNSPAPSNLAPNNPATGAPTIDGTAQAGQTLTAVTSGIADADGLTGVSYSYQWLADDVEIAGQTGSTYEPSNVDVGKTIKVRVSFSDDANHSESLTSAATATVAPRPDPLTVSLEYAPNSHDGSSAFTFDLRFSEEFALSYVTLKDHAFSETGGTVDNAQRLDPPSNIRWRITVTPSGTGNTTIVLPITTLCTAAGAICTEDSRMLSSPLALAVSGPGD